MVGLPDVGPQCRPTTARAGALAPGDRQALTAVVDAFGRLSAAAQGLKAPITDAHRLLGAPDQALYLAARRPTPHT